MTTKPNKKKPYCIRSETQQGLFLYPFFLLCTGCPSFALLAQIPGQEGYSLKKSKSGLVSSFQGYQPH